MKILVTGANGLLGQKLCHLLADSGEEFLATSRGPSRVVSTNDPVNYQSLDITDRQEVRDVLAKYSPDAVINTAAMTNVDQCEADKEGCKLLNVTAVEYLTEACADYRSRLIHLSTDFIFDGEAGPYKEEDVPNPISFYGQSKLNAEKIVLANDHPSAIIRTVLVYGHTPGMSRSNIVLWVKESLENGKPINVVDDQWRTPTLAEDLAMGCYLVAKKEATGIFHISGEETMTPYDIAIATADFFDLDSSLITRVDGSIFTQPAKRPPRTGFVIDKARSELGYSPKSFKDGLAFLNGLLNS